ncbi:GNAT family N-acetyltransferase [Schaalia vaccimaxillae]|uniref:GNAT family N-acetyltransferase n=1 Tax=Schaalia vaccimaxillae TaxID=183916 RepID=UPI0003B6E6D6|nr:GNAT family N-acetyltransferase [Schaalia vaccimaxillae]
MAVELITESTPEVVDAMARLLPQLSRSAKPLDAAGCERFISQPGVDFFVFRPDEADESGEQPILGMLSLATFEIPTGVRAWIEDVVVDEAARGQGAGADLVHAAMERAKAVGSRTVDLTSRPTREAANRLYQRIGFELRETNVYRVPLAD